jgi:hypothetical protein
LRFIFQRPLGTGLKYVLLGERSGDCPKPSLQRQYREVHQRETVTMETYETSATVEDRGQLRLSGVPFEPGTEVEVTISPKRRSAEEFTTAWRRICAELRGRPGVQNISDDDIREEIDRYRAGQ